VARVIVSAIVVITRSLTARPTSAKAAAFTAALAAVFVGVRTVSHGGHLGDLALAGSTFVHPGVSPDLPIHAGTAGYDGQFYYRLALDPLTRHATAFHITLDNPPYRQQRIGFPAAAWAVREVFRAPTSLALVLVNALAIVAIGWIGSQWAKQNGRSPLWGVALAASPALVMALARDLTEPLATAALLLGLLCWSRHRLWAASAAFAVAALCRETVLVVLIGMGLWCLVDAIRTHGPRRPAILKVAALCVPAAVEAAWQLYVRHIWGGPLPAFSGHSQVGGVGFRPLLGFFFDISEIGPTHDGVLAAVWLLERVLLLGLLIVVATGLRRSHAPAELRAGWVLAALLALSVAWKQDVEFVRAANESIIVGQLLLLSRKDKLARTAATSVIGWSALVAVVYAAAL
jgi:hypothetical protein